MLLYNPIALLHATLGLWMARSSMHKFCLHTFSYSRNHSAPILRHVSQNVINNEVAIAPAANSVKWYKTTP